MRCRSESVSHTSFKIGDLFASLLLIALLLFALLCQGCTIAHTEGYPEGLPPSHAARRDWRRAQADPEARALFDYYIACRYAWLADNLGANDYDPARSLEIFDRMMAAEFAIWHRLEELKR